MFIENINFEKRQALIVKVNTKREINRALTSLGFDQKCPVVVIVGGAGGINIDEEKAIEEAATTFANSIIPSKWEEYGPVFYIEFGTVIVIIFTLLALGVLKIIGGQEVATILAAIAGYVLGKTSRKASPTT